MVPLKIVDNIPYNSGSSIINREYQMPVTEGLLQWKYLLLKTLENLSIITQDILMDWPTQTRAILYHSLSSSRTGKSVSGRYYRVSSGYKSVHEKS